MSKSDAPEPRLLDDEPVHAIPSPWWTVVVLREGDGWYEIYQYPSEGEAREVVRRIKQNDDDPLWDKWDDVSVLSPSVEHTIPASATGMYRSYMESNSPATAARRRQLSSGVSAGSVRSSRRRR